MADTDPCPYCRRDLCDRHVMSCPCLREGYEKGCPTCKGAVGKCRYAVVQAIEADGQHGRSCALMRMMDAYAGKPLCCACAVAELAEVRDELHVGNRLYAELTDRNAEQHGHLLAAQAELAHLRQMAEFMESSITAVRLDDANQFALQGRILVDQWAAKWPQGGE